METILTPQLPWTEGGKELLQAIEAQIQREGGIAKYYQSVDAEYVKGNIRRRPVLFWQPFEVRYLLINHPVMRLEDIAHYLGRTHNSVRQKVKLLRESTTIAYKKYVEK